MKNYAFYITKEKHSDEFILASIKGKMKMILEPRGESTFGDALEVGDPKENYVSIVQLEKGSCIIFSTPDKGFYDFAIDDVHAAVLNFSLLDVEYIDVAIMYKRYRVPQTIYSYSPYTKEKNHIVDHIELLSSTKKRGFDKKLEDVCTHVLGYNILEVDPTTLCTSYNISYEEGYDLRPRRNPTFMSRAQLGTLSYARYLEYIERDEKEKAKLAKKKTKKA